MPDILGMERRVIKAAELPDAVRSLFSHIEEGLDHEEVTGNPFTNDRPCYRVIHRLDGKLHISDVLPDHEGFYIEDTQECVCLKCGVSPDDCRDQASVAKGPSMAVAMSTPSVAGISKH